ncbi:MAG TPA: ATP-binding protein [Parachlamydiaceae bacterium]|nr:ATP-binding protein [Parachlamydiaceae bacterium]
MNLNPFKFGDPVDGDYYLPREGLSGLVSQFLENRINVVLIGPRRFGKTSFVMNLLKEFEKKLFSVLFVDIFNITSHQDFLHQMLRALHAKKTWTDHLKKIGKGLAKVRPKLTTDVDDLTGQASLGLSFNSADEKDVKEQIQDVLADLDSLGKHVIIVIDEFQKVTEIDDHGWLEATLRTYMQQMRKTSFLFTGSRRSIIYDMLNNPTRPFYRSCQPIEFPAFGDEFTDWVLERFLEVGVKCDRDAIIHLRKLVQDSPNYVQMVCFHLVAEGKTHLDITEVNSTLIRVVRQNAYAYQTLLNSLSLIQQRALRLAAIEGKDVFSKELLVKYEISSTPALASAIKALKGKGILDEESAGKGTVVFDDPLFSIWLKAAFNY